MFCTQQVRIVSKTTPREPKTIPKLQDLMGDLGDGCCVAAVIAFYQPDTFPVTGTERGGWEWGGGGGGVVIVIMGVVVMVTMGVVVKVTKMVVTSVTVMLVMVIMRVVVMVIYDGWW